MTMNDVTTGKITGDFKVLINDVEGMVKATASQAGERMEDLRQRLEKKIENGRKALAERRKTWLQKGDDAKAGAESCLRENSWAGLAIATGLGVLLGLLFRRR
jgi:ElaB/YqjD/DUF883 family membrane-anchored ribosome-binding protein